MSTNTFGSSTLFEEDLPSGQAPPPGAGHRIAQLQARGLLASGGFWLGGVASLAFWISLIVALRTLTI